MKQESKKEKIPRGEQKRSIQQKDTGNDKYQSQKMILGRRREKLTTSITDRRKKSQGHKDNRRGNATECQLDHRKGARTKFSTGLKERKKRQQREKSRNLGKGDKEIERRAMQENYHDQSQSQPRRIF